MKIILIFFLCLFGCTPKTDLERVQDAFYNLDMIYVDSSLEEAHETYKINSDDYDECLLIESLILVDQQIIYIFKNPSSYLIQQFPSNKCINKEPYFIYMNQIDSSLLTIINEILYK